MLLANANPKLENIKKLRNHPPKGNAKKFPDTKRSKTLHPGSSQTRNGARHCIWEVPRRNMEQGIAVRKVFRLKNVARNCSMLNNILHNGARNCSMLNNILHNGARHYSM